MRTWMTPTTTTTMMVLAASLAMTNGLLVGCGSGGEPCSGESCQVTQQPTDPNDPSPPPSSSYSGTCCLNGQFYACSSEAAFRLCAGSDPIACHEKCAPPDFSCHMACDKEAANAKHDPSQCTRNSAKDGQCTTSSNPGTCIGSSNGMQCTYSTQCPSGYHCANGKCYSDGVGNPCTYSTECSSGNCTSGCCRGTGTGNACTYSTQCSAGLHCTNGTCYSGAKGNPCTYSTECTSGNCTNGRCQ